MPIAILAALAIASQAASAADEDWLQTLAPHVKVFYHKEDERTARYIAQASQDIYRELLEEVGGIGYREIKLYIAPTRELFRSLQPPGYIVPQWAAGVAYPEHELIVIRSPRTARGEKIDIRKTLIHEMAHMMLARALAGYAPIPKWLNEGYAMNKAGEWDLDETIAMTRTALTDSFIPFDELAVSFPIERSEAGAAYAQSFSFVSFILKQNGSSGFRAFIQKTAETGSLNYATKSSFGMTLRQLEERWRREVRLRYTWIPIVTSASGLWFLMTGLFLAGYIRKRKQAKRRLAEMELEEREEGVKSVEVASSKEG